MLVGKAIGLIAVERVLRFYGDKAAKMAVDRPADDARHARRRVGPGDLVGLAVPWARHTRLSSGTWKTVSGTTSTEPKRRAVPSISIRADATADGLPFLSSGMVESSR